jgi:hypothetical protein
MVNYVIFIIQNSITFKDLTKEFITYVKILNNCKNIKNLKNLKKS